VSVRASADGKALLAVQNLFLSSVQVLAPGSKSEVQTLSAENQARNGVDGLAWTPEGKIIYGSQSDLRGEFREMDSDGANQRLLGENALLGFSQLSVSPGGDFIAITRWLENDRSNIWRMDMSGQNPRQLTSGKQDFPPSITPDGKWVVYGSIQGDRSVLMKVSSQGGAPIQLTDYQADSPSVSPDGKWIACSTVSSSDKSPSLAVIPISGGAPTKLVELPGTVSPPPFAWSPDSREVAFINYPDGVGNVYEQPLDGGPAVPLTHFASGRIFNFQWSRQGRIVLSRGSETVDAVLLRNFRP
jgi:Tol biopolymer transport system component